MGFSFGEGIFWGSGVGPYEDYRRRILTQLNRG